MVDRIFYGSILCSLACLVALIWMSPALIAAKLLGTFLMIALASGWYSLLHWKS